MSWIIFALLSAVSAAAVAIFGKIGLKGIDTTLATSIRAVVMAIFLAAVSLGLHKWPLIKTIEGKALFLIILSGIAGAFSWLFYFLALKYGPAVGVAALDRLSVVFVLILAAVFLGESLTVRSGLAAGLITVGAILLVWK